MQLGGEIALPSIDAGRGTTRPLRALCGWAMSWSKPHACRLRCTATHCNISGRWPHLASQSASCVGVFMTVCACVRRTNSSCCRITGNVVLKGASVYITPLSASETKNKGRVPLVFGALERGPSSVPPGHDGSPPKKVNRPCPELACALVSEFKAKVRLRALAC